MTEMFARLLFITFAFAVPSLAHAQGVTEWSFLEASVPGRWNAHDLNATPGQEGLRLTSGNIEGGMIRAIDFSHGIDNILLHTTAPQATNIKFLWRDSPDFDGYVQLPIALQAGTNVIDIPVAAMFAQWDRHPYEFGIALSPSQSFVLHGIAFKEQSWTEYLSIAWNSFWTFDTVRPYTVNFLWGPVIVGNEDLRAELFDTLPPPGWSATRLWYAVIAIAVVVCGMLWFLGGERRRQGFFILGTTIALCWITFDVRMGAEVLSYMHDDVKRFVLPPLEEKELRTHEDLYAMIFAAVPELQKHDSFVLVEPTDYVPHFGLVRYFAYPSEIVRQNDATGDESAFLVLDRNDVNVNGSGSLVNGDGTVLSQPGRIVQQLSDDSFLFVVP